MGSFYHVVATRLSNDESIISPPSHCPKCNHRLKWYENIPIISYIILRGKCSKCHSKIPLSYLVVEVVTGLLFAVSYHCFHFEYTQLISLIFISGLIIVIVSDIEYMIILDEVLTVSSLLIIITYTIFLIIENGNLQDTITVSKKAAGTGGSRLGLKTNDTITVENLLYGLLLCSGNDAAVCLAEYLSGSVTDFANLMNQKASELHLTQTHFVTPHGLDSDEHYTTSYELALLANYALNNNKFKEIVGTKNYTVTINGYPKTLSNTNELLGNLNGVYGVKTGFTNGANRCLVTSIKRGDLDIICIVLGADTKKDRTKDSIELINYVFNNFEIVNIKEKIFNEFNNWKIYNSSNFVVAKGVSNNIDLVLDDLKFDYLPVNRNDIDSLSIYIYCDYNFQAPLKANSIIGYISVSLQNETILTINIRNSNTIGQKKFGSYILELTKNYTHYLENLFSCIDKF